MEGFCPPKFLGENMRLDKFLKISRIVKRRTIANEACDNKRVTVNGKTARASYQVSVGDVISVRFGETTHEYKILNIMETVKKEAAGEMYSQIK